MKNNGKSDGLRCNGPYDIAYSMGKTDGAKYSEYTEQEIAREAIKTANILVGAFSTSSTTCRYWKETAHSYMAGFSEGKGHIMTKEEWTAKFGHPLLVYQRMRFGHRLDSSERTTSDNRNQEINNA